MTNNNSVQNMKPMKQNFEGKKMFEVMWNIWDLRI